MSTNCSKGSVKLKKLITSKEVEDAIRDNKKIIYIDDLTIITPSARDIAKGYQIEFVKEEVNTQSSKGIDSELIFNALQLMQKNGVLPEMLEQLINIKPEPFKQKCYTSGFKVVRGDTVHMDLVWDKQSKTSAYIQNVICKDKYKMNVGFMVIENQNFEKKSVYDEVSYIIDGTLNVQIDGKTFIAHKEDVVFIPKETSVIFNSPNKTKVFFTTET